MKLFSENKALAAEVEVKLRELLPSAPRRWKRRPRLPNTTSLKPKTNKSSNKDEERPG
jgi:hypothetical protein